MSNLTFDRLGEWDRTLSQRIRVAENPGLLRSIAGILAHSGDSWFWIIGLMLLWLWGSAEWKTRSVILALGVIATAVLVMAMKFTIRRKRPEGEWGNIYRITDPHSFPSGHAARAFMLAVLASSFDVFWFGFTLAIWAPLVSLARVAMGLHYLSDIIAGMIIGLVIGALILGLL
ncbi:MAG: phosphatase PAP2 family protein [Chloroflexi bacterium]|nr:phosphatase PAP2 family protein [Chloroflexota bacterium]